MKTRSISYFFTREDERKLSDDLLIRFPRMRFIDGPNWLSKSPPIRDRISDCESSLIYLWDSDTFPELSVAENPRGGFCGPKSVTVIQFQRCRQNADTLSLNQMGIAIDDDNHAQKRFCEAVMRIVRKLRAGPLQALDWDTGEVTGRNITNIIVGDDAFRRSATDLTLVYGSRTYYVPDRDQPMANK